MRRPTTCDRRGGDLACHSLTQGQGSATCQSGAIADLIREIDPDRFLALGDLQYNNGRLSEFLRVWDVQFGDLRRITAPAPGNHEYGTTDAAGYFAYSALSPTLRSATTPSTWATGNRLAQLRHLRRRPWMRSRHATAWSDDPVPRFDATGTRPASRSSSGTQDPTDMGGLSIRRSSARAPPA